MIIDKIYSNNSFGRGNPKISIARVMELAKDAPKFVSRGDVLISTCPSTYKAAYFRELARAAQNDENVRIAKSMQKVFDTAKREKSYLDINL